MVTPELDGEEPDILEIFVTARDEDHIEVIERGITERLDHPRPRRGPVSEHAQMLIAGSISVRILAAGLIDWGRRAKDTTIFVDAQSEPPRIKIHAAKTPHVRRVVFLRRDGTEGVVAVDEEPANVASEVKALAG
jgi:hypothetical protein